MNIHTDTIKTALLKGTVKSIKFLKKSIKINENYYKCSYFRFNDNTITIIFYDRYIIGKYFENVYNDSDVMRDYFDDDRIFISKDSGLYKQVIKKIA